MSQMRDARRLPFFIVTKPATRAIEQHFDGAGRGALPQARSVYFAIVELANDARSETFEKPRKSIAAKAGLAVKALDRVVEGLEGCGVLVVERIQVEGHNLPNRWTLTDPPMGDGLLKTPPRSESEVGALSTQGGGVLEDPPIQEETRLRETERLEEPSRSARARASTFSYRGRSVPSDTVVVAEGLLEVFNAETHRCVGGRDGAGRPSPTLKQIVGALLARPEVTSEQWVRAVRNTVANPPDWVDGQVQIGHVFGERAAEWALANNGQAGGRHLRAAPVCSTVERGERVIAETLAAQGISV